MTGWYLSSSTSMGAPMVAGHATSTGQVSIPAGSMEILSRFAISMRKQTAAPV